MPQQPSSAKAIESNARRLAARVAIVYGIFGILWILLSDTVVVWLVHDPEALMRMQIYKGWLFIIASMLLLYTLLRRGLQEQVRLQGALVESEAAHKRSQAAVELQRAALSAAANAIVITDCDSVIETINPAFTRLTGFSETESIGQKLGTLLRSGQQPATFYQEVWTTILGGDVWQGELVNRRKDGSLYIEEQTITPVLNAEGEATHFVAVKHDITLRKQHERELEAVAAVSAALRDAATRSEMLPVVLDQVQELFAADGAIIEFVDPQHRELQIEHACGIWAPLCGTKVGTGAGINAQVFARGTPYLTNDAQNEPNFIFPTLLGPVRAIAAVPLIAQGNITGILGVGSRQPLTEHDLRLLMAIADIVASAIQRVTLYERTQMQAEEMAQIMRNIPDGLLLLDAHAHVVTATPRAQHYLQLLAGVTAGGIVERLGSSSLASLLTSPPIGEYHRVESGNRTFEVIARPVEAGTGINGWVLALRDVTDELLKLQHVQRQERLAAIGQMAAGIAHDFNNIMSVILVYTQLLTNALGVDAQMQKQLLIIEQQAQRATEMIRQILDFSRRSVMQPQTLDLLSLVWEQVKLLERTLPEHIEIMVSHTHSPFMVSADPTRLAQVIMNLSINARDAMPEGGKLSFALSHLHVSTANKSWQNGGIANLADGDWVRLTVSDTGIGIPADALEHIFEPFFTTKEPGSGTGLGLPQVYGIVGQHGGHITVGSDVGRGTMFAIYLPGVPVISDESNDAPVPKDLPKGQGESLLLVEDQGALRQSMVELLTTWNYRVIEATNGRHALEILDSTPEPIALVLTDAVMPVMGGIGLLKEIRQRGLDIPVVLVTGHPLQDELEGLRRLGMTAWLAKPVSIVQLANTLALALRP
jgi:two-component system, cell cycle sensor histidine kinase and response regulator CckA